MVDIYNVKERAVKIAEQEIGDDICNSIGIRGCASILRAIERALLECVDDTAKAKECPVEKMKIPSPAYTAEFK